MCQSQSLVLHLTQDDDEGVRKHLKHNVNGFTLCATETFTLSYSSSIESESCSPTRDEYYATRPLSAPAC